MSLADIKSILEITNGMGTPVLFYIAWLVWRVYGNHIPHLQNSLDRIDNRLARLEGRQEERDAHDAARSVR